MEIEVSYDAHIRNAVRVICPSCGKAYDLQNPPATWTKCTPCRDASAKVKA